MAIRTTAPPGARRDPTLIERGFRDQCRASLAGYKRPKRIAFEDQLPKSVVGKVFRRAVRALGRAPARARLTFAAAANVARLTFVNVPRAKRPISQDN